MIIYTGKRKENGTFYGTFFRLFLIYFHQCDLTNTFSINYGSKIFYFFYKKIHRIDKTIVF